MAPKLYPTPDDAESAFYEAFERGDIATMMAVWAATDQVVCVHPDGPRITGFEAVRDSWVQIFAGGTRLRVRTTQEKRFDGQTVAVRSVVENVSATTENAPVSLVCATNVYELTAGGWRMVLHHASAPPEPAPAEEVPATTHTLH